MIVRVWTRHSADCVHVGDVDYRRCGCPKHLQWNHDGKQFRQSAKTRSYEHAQRRAQQIELQHRQYELGEKPKSNELVTVEKAVGLYLADKKSQRLESSTLSKLETIFQKQMVGWCNDHDVYFLADFDINHLRSWRNGWKDAALAAKKKQERVRGFFYFCQSSGWLADNPAKALSRIKVDQEPTNYFPRPEFDKIIDATFIYDTKTVEDAGMQNNATRLRTLALLMRWSGLAIRDAVTLERSKLTGNRIFLYRAKTGEPVHVKVPAYVAEALRHIPPGPKPNPRYFFWSGNGNPKSAVANWQRAFRKLFTIAHIQHADGREKRCFPHMLRDTFAVELLLAGTPMDQVSVYLGHKSIKTTEKSYLPFVKARMDQMDAAMEKAFKVMRANGKHFHVRVARPPTSCL